VKVIKEKRSCIEVNDELDMQMRKVLSTSKRFSNMVQISGRMADRFAS
jgi:hypothetical protein